MRHTRLIYVTLFFLFFLSTHIASADEQVVRLQVIDRRLFPQPGTFAVTHEIQVFGQDLNLPNEQAQLKASTFRVYTKEEIDARLVKDEKTISDLNDLVLVLRQNLKDLADVNDALVRRLDEIEKRLNKVE